MFKNLFGKKESPRFKAEMEILLPQFEEKFMVPRNESWIPRIRKLLDRGDVEGLIKLLDNPNEDINTGVAWSERLHAILALGAIGSEKAINALNMIIKGDLYSSAPHFRLTAQTLLTVLAKAKE